MKNNQAESERNQFSDGQHEQTPARAREVRKVYLKAIGRLTVGEYLREWPKDLARELTRIGRGIQGRHTHPNDLTNQTHEQIERRVSGRIGPWLQDASPSELGDLDGLIAARNDGQPERGQRTPDAWDREHDPAAALGRLVFREQQARNEHDASAQS